MVIKEIKKSVIDQMKSDSWTTDNNREFHSKLLAIELTKTDENFFIKNGYHKIRLNRYELGIGKIYFWWLMRGVKKSCSLAEKRKKDKQLASQWKSFLDNNKDIRRDSTIDKILD